MVTTARPAPIQMAEVILAPEPRAAPARAGTMPMPSWNAEVEVAPASVGASHATVKTRP